MSRFTPIVEQTSLQTIYFEDSQIRKIPGYSTGKSESALKNEVTELLVKMGAHNIVIYSGEFDGMPKRLGYQIQFMLGTMPARLHCAALPLKASPPSILAKKTVIAGYKHKREQSLKQALYLLRDWLQASLWINQNQPPADTLVPYLLDKRGITIAETLLGQANLPMLPPPKFDAK